MTDHAIDIDNVVKKFGDFIAVDNISLIIKKGEIFGLLGPNGAGKTTTINMILGLIPITKGRIFVNEIDINKDPTKVKQLMGLMTQETVVEGDLTARQNLEIFAELYHVPKDEIPRRIERALKDAELTEFANKKAGTFSGGMKRRLELVKSMIQEPKILILDEPTTGLDIQNRFSMWARIKELNHKGVTIILTTQYLEEADNLCGRIAIIDHGKIKAMGTSSELKKIVGAGRILEITVEGNGDAAKVSSVLKSKFKLDPTVTTNKVTAVLSTTKEEMLAKILTELDNREIKVTSVNLHLPTLDDVFIKLTGAAFRDATGAMTGSRTDVMLKSMR